MDLVSEQDRARIAEAIRRVEARTSGEMVTVIAGRSDSYLWIPLLWASLGALLAPGIILYLPYQWQWIMGSLGEGHDWAERVTLDHATVWAIQITVFLVLALLLRWEPLKMLVIPRGVKHHRAGRAAREQFYVRGPCHSRDRTGVLFYVSAAERYVEVIADQALSDRVEPEVWRRIVDDFVAHVRHERVAEGFIVAVGACGELLARHFPRAPGDDSKRPDDLVVIE